MKTAMDDNMDTEDNVTENIKLLIKLNDYRYEQKEGKRSQNLLNSFFY